MGAVQQGEVIRFDQVKGYGFISPRGEGDDVFLHVNDLLDDKHLIRPGVTVEFVLESGEKGPKASSVHLVHPAPGSPPALPSTTFASPQPAGSPASRQAADPESELVDVVTEAELTAEITELLLRVEPVLTAPQILAVRGALLPVCRRYGWIAD